MHQNRWGIHSKYDYSLSLLLSGLSINRSVQVSLIKYLLWAYETDRKKSETNSFAYQRSLNDYLILNVA